MSASKKTARVAGLLYLLVAITGAFSILIVPETLIVRGDAAQTVANITASELLFRAGIVSGLLCQITFIFLVLTLYRLFQDVDRSWAAVMVALVMAAVPVAFLNMLNQLAVLVLLSGSGFLTAFTTSQLQAMVMMFLGLHDQGIAAVELFWGLWLFPFGVLVYRSGFIPRVFGVFLVIACFSYLADSLTVLLAPQANELVSSVTGTLSGLGEFAILLWLLIKGVRHPARAAVMVKTA